MKEDKLLTVLRNNPDTYVSGEALSRQLKVTRTAIWKHIEDLRELGYKIDAQTKSGYRLISAPDKLFSDEISHNLKTEVIGREIYSYDSLDSTNDTVYQLGEKGAKEGVCVFAEHQKKGRGRLGRVWSSPKSKNILVSLLLRPVLPPADVAKVTIMVGLAAANALIKTAGKGFGIKWPNDIFYEGKKICGILTEMSAESDRVRFIVVGIGINLNSAAEDLPPQSISLKKITGENVSRVSFAKTLLKELDLQYLRFKKNEFAKIVDDWEELSVTSGQRVTATTLGRKVHGEAVGIDVDGALWVRKDNGLQERITSGDVQHLRTTGK